MCKAWSESINKGPQGRKYVLGSGVQEFWGLSLRDIGEIPETLEKSQTQTCRKPRVPLHAPTMVSIWYSIISHESMK